MGRGRKGREREEVKLKEAKRERGRRNEDRPVISPADRCDDQQWNNHTMKSCHLTALQYSNEVH